MNRFEIRNVHVRCSIFETGPARSEICGFGKERHAQGPRCQGIEPRAGDGTDRTKLETVAAEMISQKMKMARDELRRGGEGFHHEDSKTQRRRENRG
jgi:hypothetical protein